MTVCRSASRGGTQTTPLRLPRRLVTLKLAGINVQPCEKRRGRHLGGFMALQMVAYQIYRATEESPGLPTRPGTAGG